jgi:hypothetical protein
VLIILFGKTLLFGQILINLKVDQPDNLVVSAGEEKTIVQGDPVRIGGNPTARAGYGNYRFIWTPQTGLDNPTDPNPVATPTESTLYTVTVYDGEGCYQSGQVWVHVQATGTGYVPELPGLLLYPNPVVDNLNLTLTGTEGETRVILWDAIGNVVLDKYYFSRNLLSVGIDLTDLAPGTYIIRVKTTETIYNKHIIKQ